LTTSSLRPLWGCRAARVGTGRPAVSVG